MCAVDNRLRLVLELREKVEASNFACCCSLQRFFVDAQLASFRCDRKEAVSRRLERGGI